MSNSTPNKKTSRFKIPRTSPSTGVGKKSRNTPTPRKSIFRLSVTPSRQSPKPSVDLRSSGDANIGAIVYSPRKLKAKVKTYDRFIPNRHAMDNSSSNFNLHKNDKLNTLDSSSLAYQEVMAKACGVALEKRILSFSVEPPPSDRHELRATWNRPAKPKNASARRRIGFAPDKILDAPGLADDYYLNLMDWSSKNILAIGLENTVYIWNGDTGDVKEFCKTKADDYVASLKWAADGSYLSVGTGLGDAQIWDVDSFAKIRSMRGHTSRVGVMSWDQHILSSGSKDGSIWNHDVRIAQHKVGELMGHTAEVCGLQWRPDGAYLASGGNDNLVQIWDVRSSIPKMTKSNHQAAVKAIAWCPWQLNLLATGGGTSDHMIHFWNSTTGGKTNSIQTGSQVTSIQWSISYKEFISSHGFPSNQLSVWSYPSLQKIADLPGHDARVLNTALSPDGETVASSSSDENLKFWKVFEKQKGKDKKLNSSSNTLDLEEDLMKSYGRMTIR